VAVRGALAGVGPGPVLVACSGGADSLALAAATRFECGRAGRAVGLVTVDHGLQPGSSAQATAVAAWATTQGFDPVLVEPVRVSGPGGPEAAARAARYAALVAAAHRTGASAVLLGHTLDDQAETVLLALARGAGPRGLSGMPAQRSMGGVVLLRPLLGVSRAQTVDACAAQHLQPWQDPHNRDPAYARARVRAALPTLVAALGPDVVTNLARTAALVAADNAALDALAQAAADSAAVADDTGPTGTALDVAALADLAPAIRTRVLHGWARALGAPGAALAHRHVDALDALVTSWHGQGPVALPGGIRVARRNGRLAPVGPPSTT